jgi:enoyl-CoA hydratase/carnithine racemase
MSDVLSERHDGVLVLRINRPERHNSIGGTVLRDLAAGFAEAAADDSIRVVVTTATGDAFCVGADASDLSGGERPPARELLASVGIGGEKGLAPLSAQQIAADELGNAGRWAQLMWQLEKPTIAAVNGTAVGGGFAIALLSDIVLAARSARMGAGFAPIGLAPELGMSYLLPRLVGPGRAAELVYTGRLVTADDAAAMGLVTEVVDDAALQERALTLATRIAAMPPLGLQLSKRLLRTSMTSGFSDQLRAEYATHVVLFDHPDTHAAMDRLVARLGKSAT